MLMNFVRRIGTTRPVTHGGAEHAMLVIDSGMFVLLVRATGAAWSIRKGTAILALRCHSAPRDLG